MEIVKKWASCFISFVAGVLALALSACSGMIKLITIAGQTESETTKAFKVLTDGDLLKQAEAMDLGGKFTTMKVFSIVLMVVAVLLLAYSIVMLLKNFNVIKLDSKVFAIVGLSLAVLFLISTIGVFVSSLTYANAATEFISDALKAYELMNIKVSGVVKLGVYQPIMLATGIISTAVVTAFEIRNVK